MELPDLEGSEDGLDGSDGDGPPVDGDSFDPDGDDPLPDGDEDGDGIDGDCENHVDGDMGTEEEMDEEIPESDPSFTNAEACELPRRSLSRWVNDFPRVYPTGFYTVNHSYDGTAVLSNGGTMAMLFKNEEPALFHLPSMKSNTKGPREFRPQTWHYFSSIDGYSIFHEDTRTFETIIPDFVTGSAANMDSEGVIWAFPGACCGSEAFKIENATVQSLTVLREDVDDFIYASSPYAPLMECNGYLYAVSNFLDSGDGVHTGLMRKNSENDLLWDLVFLSMPATVWGASFTAASLNPETCEFVATGVWNLLEGTLGETVEVSNEQQTIECDPPCSIEGCLPGPDVELGESQPPPYKSYMDWETGTLWGARDLNSGNGSYCPKFFRRLPGSTTFEMVEPLGPLPGVHWIPTDMDGNGEESVIIAGFEQSYRWNPEEDEFKPIYEDPFFGEFGERKHSYARSLAVGVAPNGVDFRVHIAGRNLPVQVRDACYEWSEAFPDSEQTLAVSDNGEDIVAVGLYQGLMIFRDGQWQTLEGPPEGWVAGLEVYLAKSGDIYVISLDDDVMQTRTLWRLPAAGSEDTGWRKVTGFETAAYDWRPHAIIGAGDEVIVQSYPYKENVGEEGYSCIATYHRLYAVNKDMVTQFHLGEGRAYLRSHWGRLFYFPEGDLMEIQPGTHDLQVALSVPSIPYLQERFYDAVQLESGRWIALTKYQDIGEYDPSTETWEFYASGSVSACEDGTDLPYLLYDENVDSLMFLERLPTGEVLVTGQAGVAVLRASDGQWELPVP